MIQVLKDLNLSGEDYHIVAIEGAALLMPLSWLILAGWSYVPKVENERMKVTVVSPGGKEQLVERSKMH